MATWAPGGNLPPLVAAASLLAARGHSVELIGSAATRAVAERAGISTRAYERTGEPDLRIAFERQATEMLSTAAGLSVAEDVRDATEAIRPDLVIADCMLPAALAGAQAAGVPTAALVHFLYGPPRRTMREHGGAFTTDLERLNATRRALALRPASDGLDAWEAPDLLLVGAPVWLDVDLDFPPNVVHAGPLGVRTEPGPEDRRGVRPRILLSFSTTVMDGQLETVQRACDAVAEMDADAILTLGPAIEAADLRVPAGVEVTAWADHARLLPGCDAAISHAGLGTALRALAHGVPLVMLPLGRDQRFNAGRVAAREAGIELAPDARPHEIRTALERVLTVPAFRAAAAAAAARIAADDPNRRAAEAFEGCIAATGRIDTSRPSRPAAPS